MNKYNDIHNDYISEINRINIMLDAIHVFNLHSNFIEYCFNKDKNNEYFEYMIKPLNILSNTVNISLDICKQ